MTKMKIVVAFGITNWRSVKRLDRIIHLPALMIRGRNPKSRCAGGRKETALCCTQGPVGCVFIWSLWELETQDTDDRRRYLREPIANSHVDRPRLHRGDLEQVIEAALVDRRRNNRTYLMICNIIYA